MTKMVAISPKHKAKLKTLLGMYTQAEVAAMLGRSIHTVMDASRGVELRDSTAAWIESQLDKVGGKS